MKKLFGQITLVLSLFCFGNAFAGKMFCNSGWHVGDQKYDMFKKVVISDKKIFLSESMNPERDNGYKIQEGSQSATLSLSVGWKNKEKYGSNAVLSYRPIGKTETSFAKANYAFARECLVNKLSPDERKHFEEATLNPKAKSRK